MPDQPPDQPQKITTKDKIHTASLWAVVAADTNIPAQHRLRALCNAVEETREIFKKVTRSPEHKQRYLVELVGLLANFLHNVNDIGDIPTATLNAKELELKELCDRAFKALIVDLNRLLSASNPYDTIYFAKCQAHIAVQLKEIQDYRSFENSHKLLRWLQEFTHTLEVYAPYDQVGEVMITRIFNTIKNFALEWQADREPAYRDLSFSLKVQANRLLDILKKA